MAISVLSAGEWTGAAQNIGNPAGTDRLLVCTWVSNNSNSATSLTYGGQVMTPLIPQRTFASSNYRVFYLLEAGIAAAVGTAINKTGAGGGGGAFVFFDDSPQEAPAYAFNIVAGGAGTGPHTVTFPDATLGNSLQFPDDGAWASVFIQNQTQTETGSATFTNVTATWGQDNSTGDPSTIYYADPADVINGSSVGVTLEGLGSQGVALMHLGVGLQPVFSAKTIRRTNRRLFAI